MDMGTVLPKLVYRSMFMKCIDPRNREYMTSVDVELWESTNLALHTWINKKQKTWRISEFDSGKCILKNIPNRQEALSYMMELRDILHRWSSLAGEMADVMCKVKDIQKRIDHA